MYNMYDVVVVSWQVIYSPDDMSNAKNSICL